MKKKSLLTLMVVAAAILLAACAPNNPQGSSAMPIAPQVSQTQPAQQAEQSAFGHSQLVEGVTIKLLGAVQSKGEGIYTANAGQIFVQPQFEINNQSTQGTKVAMAFNFFVDGVNMPEDTAAVQSADKGALGTTLDFGKSVTGFTGVRAPENWKQIKVQYSPHIIGDKAEFIIMRSDLP